MGVLYPIQSIQLDDENKLSPEATIENEDLSCFLQRMQDLLDSQQPHCLVLIMYCTRTEFLLLALEVCVSSAGWLIFSLVCLWEIPGIVIGSLLYRDLVN